MQTIKRLKKAFLVGLTMAILVSSLAINAFAGNGDHVNVDRSKDSTFLMIGDSRMVMTSQDVGKCSYNATWGAHYKYLKAWVSGSYAKKPMVITCDKYLAQQKAIIKNTLKAHSSCKVIVFSTINDASWWSDSAAAVKSLVSELRGVSVNGKKADIYITSMIPEKGKDKNVASYNSTMKKWVSDKRKDKKTYIHYIDLGLTSTWSKYYDSGKLHFTKAGSKKLWNDIVTAVRSGKI